MQGQFDQRADSAEQCIRFLNEEETPVVRTAVTYVIEGVITEEELARIKSYCINPVDSRETDMEKPETLIAEFEEPADVAVLDGFVEMEKEAFEKLYRSLNLAIFIFRSILKMRKREIRP